MRNGELSSHVSQLSALSTVPRSPKYSMRSRCGTGVLGHRQNSPGPGNYAIPSSFKPRSMSNSSLQGSRPGNRKNVSELLDCDGISSLRELARRRIRGLQRIAHALRLLSRHVRSQRRKETYHILEQVTSRARERMERLEAHPMHLPTRFEVDMVIFSMGHLGP